MTGPDRITDETFDRAVIAAGRPVLVDFSAAWCGPCKAMAPAIADLAREYDGEVDIVVMDIDESPKTAERFGIRGVPTFIVFKEDAIMSRVSGGTSRTALAQIIEAVLER